MTTTTTVTASSGTYSLDTDNYTITMDSDSYITMGDTITVPANSLDGVSLDPVSFNTDFTKSPSSIRIGDIEITEEKFSKIEALNFIDEKTSLDGRKQIFVPFCLVEPFFFRGLIVSPFLKSISYSFPSL